MVGVSGATYMKLAFAITWLLFVFGFFVITFVGAFGANSSAVETLPPN